MWKETSTSNRDIHFFTVSEGLNSVESNCRLEHRAGNKWVSEGLNSVESGIPYPANFPSKVGFRRTK